MSRTSLILNPWLRRLLNLAICLSQHMGLLNFSISFNEIKSSLQPYRPRILYCAIIHLIYIGLLPFSLTSSYGKEAAIEQTNFYVALNNGFIALRLPAILLTLWCVWWHSKSLYRVMYRFEKLRLRNFHTLYDMKRLEILRQNDKYIWLKLMTSSGSMVMFYLRICMFVRNPSWQFIWMSVYYGSLESLTIFNVNFFYCGMCYANCALCYVETELKEFHRHLDLGRLQRLLKIFAEIRKLSTELSKIFQWQLLAIMFATMVALISLFFSLIVWWCRSLHTFKYPLLFFGLFMAFVNFGDLYLIALMCADVKKRSENVQRLLWKITMRRPEHSYYSCLQNNLNFFSLTTAFQRVHVNIGGLFELDVKWAFSFLQATIVYLTILAQFDLKTY